MELAPSETLQSLGWRTTQRMNTEYGSTARLILLSEILLWQNQVWDLSSWDGQFQAPEFITLKYNEPSRGARELSRRSSLMVWFLTLRLCC